MTIVPESAIANKLVYLPEPWKPDVMKKVLIFDMDETLIHCVDDIETQNPDVILEIDFPGEETVCAGINIRPYVMECLQEANKTF
jgi:FMN phosphatase YigB (HAD superfamily)